MRTLHLTSPLMRGDDVANLQKLLRAKGWYRDTIDGIYGPLTAQAVWRAKWWLGYVKADHNAGDLLISYLDGRRRQGPQMLARVRLRMRAGAPLRQRALDKLTGKLGTKEDPAGSNRCWASEWYGVIGPWCAMAVTWAYAQAGSAAFSRGQRYAYVPFIVADARAGRNHLTMTTDPQPGDLVAYDWNSDGVSDHVGLFEKWASGSRDAFTAIEGNTAIDNDSNGGEVMRRNRVRSQVQAFIHVGA